MSVTSWKFPGTIINADRDEMVSSWTNVANAGADDGSYAYCTIDKTGYGDWLRCTNFGFTTSDLPELAAIDGIEVAMGRGARWTDSVVMDSAIYLRTSTGQVGDNYATAEYWTYGETEELYGGSTDTWNSGLSRADILTTGFGIDLSIFTDQSRLGDAQVDYIKIRVYYSVTLTAFDEELDLNQPFSNNQQVTTAIAGGGTTPYSWEIISQVKT